MARVIPIAAAAPAVQRAGLTQLPPLALYVHFPWCVRKCPYCDFNSHEVRGEIPEAAYLAALVADLDSALPTVWGRRIVSIFVGGGTPSLLSPEALDALLSAIRARLPLAPEAEITLEANPGALDAGRLAGFRAAGVNRVSLGIQSFDPARLAALGRIHDEHQARQALDTALRHFERVNLDLMYATPGQTLEGARRDFEIAVASGVGHVSAYQLAIEPNTAFHHRPPPLPEADLAADMQDTIEGILADAGFGHYEISAFARPGERCAHNLNYWQFGDYLGIGAGAHGKLSSPQGIVRETRWRQPREYMARAMRGEARQRSEAVDDGSLPFEFMMNALRLVEGVDAGLFPARTGLPLKSIGAKLEQAIARGLLSPTPGRFGATATGRRFLNDLLQMFLA